MPTFTIPSLLASTGIQAEDGDLLILDQDANGNDTALRNTANPEPGFGLRPGFSGAGYIDFGDTPGDALRFTLDVAQAGSYDFNIRYASQAFGTSPRSLTLALNNGAPVVTPFPDTGPATGPADAQGFNVWGFLTRTLALTAGTNTITLAIPPGAAAGPNIDRIEITAAGTGPMAPDATADADDNLFLDGPDTALGAAGIAAIDFTLTGIDADIVKIEISLDGGATRTNITGLPDASGHFVFDGSTLPTGTSSAVTVYVTDGLGNEAAASTMVARAAQATQGTVIQAEDTTRVSVQDSGSASSADFTRIVDAAHPDSGGNVRSGAVGGAYMDFGANAGDAITITYNAPSAGTYDVAFRYGNGGGTNRPLALAVNGTASGTLDFPPAGSAGSGTTATGWTAWGEVHATVTLTAGTNTLRLAIPPGAGAGPNIDQIVFQPGGGPVAPGFPLAIEAENFAVLDTTGTGQAVTQPRVPGNTEPNQPLLRDTNGDGLWDGFTGTGYLDMGGNVGDAGSFTVTTAAAGLYSFAFRYAHGGSPQTSRPMTLSAGGQSTTVAFPGTGTNGWDGWQVATVQLQLAAGTNTVTLSNTIANGPNIDNVTITPVTGNPGQPGTPQTFEEVVRVNFQPPAGQASNGLPAGYVTPAGYQVDSGAAFGSRGNGFSYGWVTEASVADGTANGTIASALPGGAVWYRGTVLPGTDNLHRTFAHFEYPSAGAAGARAWEMALANGTYQLKVSVGDSSGPFDSNYAINVEGQNFGQDWTPANPGGGGAQTGGGFRSTLVTGVVQVNDGRLTIDSIGGNNTEIQYLEVERVPDLTPSDGRSADLDYSFFTTPRAAWLNSQVSIAIGPDGALPTGIDPRSSFVVGVQVQAGNHRGPNITQTDDVVLVETLTGIEVPARVQLSGGSDSMTIRPLAALKELTSYTLKVENVLDLGSITDGSAPLRQMQDLTTTFVTGTAPVEPPRQVAFTSQVLLNGFADGAAGFTGLQWGVDGKLYVSTINGEIHRWSVLDNGGLDAASHETLSLSYFDEGAAGRRGIIGMAFDPDDANVIWVSDNYPIPLENKAFSTPEFSGRISKITLGPTGSFQGATAETYISGLPRSGGDHVTNSIVFRENPLAEQAGQPDHLLYVTQGSNSSGGAPDEAWGNRPERLLNATVLEIDTTRDAPAGGYDVRTEPVTTPTTSNPLSAFNANGTYPGFYNPFAGDAVLKIYATGIRNAYDMVWHSNGQLYVPTNGSAAGGKTPDDPSQAGSQALTNAPLQHDYLFTVQQGGYYGHPNILRDEYIMNGGNPTAGTDPNEIITPANNPFNFTGYATGTQTDPDYDVADIYNLGDNQSPNGAIEYRGGAFGSSLQGALLVTQFSTGDNIRMLRLNAAGDVIEDDVLRRPDGTVINNFTDPLDIIEDPVTGQLYVMTLDRSSGASQLILLTPAPGNTVPDATADEGGNLALSVVNGTNRAAMVFQVAGLDSDVVALSVSLNGGTAQTVALNAQNQFTINASSITGAINAQLTVTDDAGNNASASTSFGGSGLVSRLIMQAEDVTPGDGTAVTISAGSGSQIAIRSASNPEPSGTGLVNGLRPGAFGLDGNTSNTDGTPGGYADFGAHAGDFVTFAFNLAAASAGSGVIRVRYGNGGTADRPLEVLVNGASAGTYGFSPPPGLSGDAAWAAWQSLDVAANLVAGNNTVSFRAPANTGPNIDQIQVLTTGGGTPGGGDPNADITVQSLDANHFNDRLVFSYLEDPDAQNPSLVDRDYKDTGVVRVTNSGTTPLAIQDVAIDGPFTLATALEGQSIAPGAFIDATVQFNRAAYAPPTSNVDGTSTTFQGALRITTNDAENPVTTVDLAGFWQARDEGGQEPNVNEVWQVFGFGNSIQGLSLLGAGENSALNDRDLYRPVDGHEVMSPYWRIADGYSAATVTHIAAFHGNGGAAVSFHAPGNKGQQVYLSSHAGHENQTLLPLLSNGNFATGSITAASIPDAWNGNDVFGLSIDSLSTDPRLNPSGGGSIPADGAGITRGYTHRVFQALDQNGTPIPNVYLAVMDYTGINYDYNDNMVLIEGVTPVGLGPTAPSNGMQVAFSGAGLAVGASTIINATQFDYGGQGIAYNDTSPTTDQGGTLGRNEGVDIMGNNLAIGHVAAGEWVEYTLNVAQAGNYNLGFVAALGEAASNRTVTASFTQGRATYETAAPITVTPTGAWSSYQATAEAQVQLEAGYQTMRLTFGGGSQNIQAITLEQTGSASAAASAMLPDSTGLEESGILVLDQAAPLDPTPDIL